MKTSLRRSVRRSLWAACAAALLSLSVVVTAQAADTLDQSVPTGGVNPSASRFQQLQQMGQTFTAGVSGPLDKVSLFQGAPGWLPPSITIQIWTVDQSQPTLTNLGGTPPSFPETASTGTPSWHDFTLSPAVQVVAGTQYAIVVVSRPSSFWWSFMGWSYAGGNLWLCCDATGKWMSTTGQDFAFKTWVSGAPASPPPGNQPPANQPPAVTVDHPTGASFTEGATPTMTGTVSDPDGDNVTAKASAGTLSVSSGKWTWTGAAPSDEGPHHVVITADDGHGNVVSAAFDYTVSEVTPTATINGFTAVAPLVLLPQESLTFTGSFSDPGPETHTATWNFGDGTPSVTLATPDGLMATHAYSKPGTYAVKLTVADDEIVSSPAATLLITVQTTQQALSSIKAFVDGLQGLNDGQKHSLEVKLDAAADSAGRGLNKTAGNQLNAFLNEVQAYVNGSQISAQDAAKLRAAVDAVKVSLGTSNRFLEWWPLAL